MQYKFNTSCSKDKLKEIRLFVSKVLNKYNIPEVKKNELILAVDEVCANLIIHSHNCNPKESFKLMIDIDHSKGITFDIIDQGIGFNIAKYREPSINEIKEKRQKGGMGLILVKRIMDNIEFKCGPDKNVCRMFKKIKIDK